MRIRKVDLYPGSRRQLLMGGDLAPLIEMDPVNWTAG